MWVRTELITGSRTRSLSICMDGLHDCRPGRQAAPQLCGATCGQKDHKSSSQGAPESMFKHACPAESCCLLGCICTCREPSQQGLSPWAVCHRCCTSGPCTQQLLARVSPDRRNCLDHAGDLLQTTDVHCRPPRVISTSANDCCCSAGMGITISMPPEDDASSDSDARSDSDDEDYLSESLVCAPPGLLLD